MASSNASISLAAGSGQRAGYWADTWLPASCCRRRCGAATGDLRGRLLENTARLQVARARRAGQDGDRQCGGHGGRQRAAFNGAAVFPQGAGDHVGGQGECGFFAVRVGNDQAAAVLGGSDRCSRTPPTRRSSPASPSSARSSFFSKECVVDLTTGGEDAERGG